MLVTTAFEPTRDDELSVRSGEILRLVKEFEDEWCLVQRVGGPEAERGVIPRFCLVDRPRVIKSRVTLSGLTYIGAGRN
jgi:Variant SH3 domain